MDWGRLIMEWGWVAIAVPLLALVGTTVVSIIQDKRGWKNVQSKIGENKRSSLEEQHKDIKDSMVERTSSIYDKVSNIDKEIYASKKDYENLNLDQKEVRNNVNKLVLDWEKTISDNKELKSQIDYLKQEKYELKIEKDKTTEKLNRLTKTIEVNDTLKYENVELRHEVDSLKNKNSSLINQNQKLLITNKDLLKKLDTAKRMLGIENIPQEQDSELNKEKEEDWGMEL